MHQDSINRAVDGEPETNRCQDCETGRERARDGAHEASRERTAKSAWCGKQRRKAPPDMLTGRSVQACLSREVPTDHEACGHRSSGCGKSESAAAELCSGVETTQLWRERTPEAKAEHRHDRVYTQALSERTEAGQRRERERGGNSVVPVSPRSHAQHVGARA